jgi:hypothetical protein
MGFVKNGPNGRPSVCVTEPTVSRMWTSGRPWSPHTRMTLMERRWRMDEGALVEG